MEITCVTIDCSDPKAMSEFWNEALGWGGAAAHDDGTIAICGSARGGTYLEFVKVSEPKQVKNRVHLGCSAGELSELDAEIVRLEHLGAVVAWEEEFAESSGYRNVVLRDIEDNEFCLGARSRSE